MADTSGIVFQPATLEGTRARVALCGAAGSGKTKSGLLILRGIIGKHGKMAVIDTERKSASKYKKVTPFSTINLTEFAPRTYVACIQAAEEQGFDGILIDSLSHAWMGTGGALEMVDQKLAASGGNKWAAWKDVTPEHQRLIDAIVGSELHIVATMRSKTEWEVIEDRGKKVPKKIGTAPVQREGMDFEFDICGDLDDQHVLRITKTRCEQLDRAVIDKPNEVLGEAIRAWLTDDEAATAGNGDGGAAKPKAPEARVCNTIVKVGTRQFQTAGAEGEALSEIQNRGKMLNEKYGDGLALEVIKRVYGQERATHLNQVEGRAAARFFRFLLDNANSRDEVVSLIEDELRMQRDADEARTVFARAEPVPPAATPLAEEVEPAGDDEDHVTGACVVCGEEARVPTGGAKPGSVEIIHPACADERRHAQADDGAGGEQTTLPDPDPADTEQAAATTGGARTSRRRGGSRRAKGGK